MERRKHNSSKLKDLEDLTAEQKFILLKKEKSNLSQKEEVIYMGNKPIIDLNEQRTVFINVINIKNGKIEILGKIRGIFRQIGFNFYYEVDENKKELELIPSKYFKKEYEGEDYQEYYNFKIIEELEKITSIKFYYEFNGTKQIVVPWYTQKSKLNNKLDLCYQSDGYSIRIKDRELRISKNNQLINRGLLKQLIRKRKFKIILIRLFAKLYKRINKKQIWIISDRTEAANDNGLHFFKYANKVNDRNIKKYFVIAKETKDYNKVKQYGKVLPYNSLKYKLLFLVSTKIISSQADEWVTNAFNKSEGYYRDLYTFDFVFLQHGIIKDDMTRWLNKTNQNIDKFVTSAKKEYNSLLELEYGYDDTEVVLTGLPRYDNLKDSREKLIAIMPTWRKDISGKVNKLMGNREYSVDFRNTKYFKFYNGLINDKKLLNILKKNNYKGIFVVHPSNMPNFKDFEPNEIISVVEGFADYQDIFARATLLITDFSSVAFDFAYLRKPIIYSQFDEKTFFSGHLYTKGYYDYRIDGFGPVLNTKKEVIDEIEKSINNNCKLENKYKNRIEEFYCYNDTNNCKRLYDIITKE